MIGYSLDLRERMIGQWQMGETQVWLAETGGVNINSVKRYVAQFKAVGHVPANVQGRHKIRDEQLVELAGQLETHNNATLAEPVALWEASHDVCVSLSTLWMAIERASWTYIKRVWGRRNALRLNGYVPNYGADLTRGQAGGGR